MQKHGTSLEASQPQQSVPKRIAFCITDLNPGGAEKALFEMVRRLDRNQWESAVYCLGPRAELACSFEAEGIPVRCYGAASWRDVGVVGWLKRQLREFRPELLQCSLFHANFVGSIAGWRAGLPKIVAGHRVAEREKRWHLKLLRWTRSLVDHHVCVSRGVADQILQELRLSPEQVSVIPNGVSMAVRDSASVNLKQEFGLPAEAQVVLSVGRLHPQKGLLVLLDAFQELAEKFPQAYLMLVGEGPQREELTNRIRKLNLSDRILLAGYRRDVPQLMSQADVLVQASLWEGMPNAVLEAMACGLAVVTTDVEGIAELLQNEEHGLVVTRGDSRGLAHAMARLLDDLQLRLRLSRSAQSFCQHKFTWEEVARSYDALYQRLLT